MTKEEIISEINRLEAIRNNMLWADFLDWATYSDLGVKVYQLRCELSKFN